MLRLRSSTLWKFCDYNYNEVSKQVRNLYGNYHTFHLCFWVGGDSNPGCTLILGSPCWVLGPPVFLYLVLVCIGRAILHVVHDFSGVCEMRMPFIIAS